MKLGFLAYFTGTLTADVWRTFSKIKRKINNYFAFKLKTKKRSGKPIHNVCFCSIICIKVDRFESSVTFTAGLGKATDGTSFEILNARTNTSVIK